MKERDVEKECGEGYWRGERSGMKEEKQEAVTSHAQLQ